MTTVWILIVFAFAGPLSNTDSVALTSTQFTSQATCEAAGKATVQMASFTQKVIKYVCVKS